MKKGFTMIELIFVIVILGVLASVAIPRLAATRDDAELSKATANLTLAVRDIAAYYTAKGTFDTTITNMTNALSSGGKLQIKKKDCATVTVDNTKGEIGVSIAGMDSPCPKLKDMPGIKDMCTSGTISSNCKIKVGGADGITW